MGANSRDFLDMRELEETADTTPTNLTLNKALLNTRVQQIKQEVDEGRVNPLEAYIFLNWMMKVADAAKAQLKEEAIEEAEKHSEKDIKVYDATVTVKNGAGRYSYPDYIKDLQEQHKLAYQAAQKGQTITDEEGTVIEPAKYSPGSQTLSIKFL